MKKLDKLKEIINKMNNDYPRPKMEPLAISELYDLANDWPKKEWPNSKQAGVYVFLDQNLNMLYVGKASCSNNIGSRLGGYFKYGENIQTKTKDPLHEIVRYVITVAVPEDHSFEAPAIEEFLITNLHPPLNKLGRRPE